MTRSATLWREAQPLVLASRSPARRTMLEAAAFPVDCDPADVDEASIQSQARARGTSGEELAGALALAKALRVSQRSPGRYVLGADQTLVLANEVLSKPGSSGRARAQLKLLAGREHRLCSAAALVRDGAVLVETCASATIRFRPLSDAAIEDYFAVAGKTVEDCVGAYQLEALGVHLFEAVGGDYWTILGLPMLGLCAEMRRLGLLGT